MTPILATIDRFYPILALAVLAAATVWLERITRSEDPQPRTAVRADPDFTGETIRLTRFDDTGALRYVLAADSVRHFPEGNVAEFFGPRFRQQTENGVLRVRADHGTSLDGGEVLHLSGDTQVFRDDIDGSVAFSLHSDSLTLWPQDQRALTDDPVILTQGGAVAHGNAMRADNLFGTLELIGDVRVTMAPRASGAAQ